MKKRKENKKKPKIPGPPPESDPAGFGKKRFGAWQFLQDISASRTVFLFCALILPIAALANFPSSIPLNGDQDMWFHLAYGREYIQNMSWHLDHSQFSWTPARAEWMYGTWLGSSLLYMIHHVFGVYGLFAVHWLLLAASAGIMLWFARSAGVNTGLGLLTGLLMAATALSFAGIFVKPEMFSIMLITLTAVTCFRFKIAPGPWIMIVLPVIFIFWVNIHGLWFFGLAFIGLLLFMELLVHFFSPNQGIGKKGLVMFFSAAGLSVFALIANPEGVFYPASVISDLLFPKNIEMIKQVKAYHSMWRQLLFSRVMSPGGVAAWAMTAMCLAHIALWLRSWRRTGHADIPSAAINIAFFLIGMYMARLTILYAMIWLPSMTFLIWRQGPKPAFPKVGPVILGVFLLLSGITAVKTVFFLEDRSWLGAGYRDYVPDREAAFIMDHNLPGPMFNDYVSGGYLMWGMYPEHKVFIDPRFAPYLDQVFPDYVGIGTEFPNTNRGLAAFTDRYPARIALVRHQRPELILWFHHSPDWSLAYFDTNASVMLHRDVGTRLPPEAREVSLSPERYKNVSNPQVLTNMFTYYTLYGTHLAAVIRDYFEKNVCNLYYQKNKILEEMDRTLRKGQANNRR